MRLMSASGFQVCLVVILLAAPIFVATGAPSGYLPVQSNIAQTESRSIILMIGDGMGYEHMSLAGLVEYNATGTLSFETLTWNASVITSSLDAEITDSAAAGTAIATGNKTNNNMIAVTPSGEPLETILEIAQKLNKSTGLVTTTMIQHATPAAFMTHVESRSDYSEITSQIVEQAGVDVLMGGGLQHFSQNQLNTMASNGYTLVTNRTALLDFTSGKILGLFADSYMDEERYRDYTATPSILEMTNKSIELLSQDEDGFFLMVEGGQIDFAGHDNDRIGVALETIEFDKAVALALEFVQDNPDTILIVTADHETGGMKVVGHNLDDVLPGSLMQESDRRSLRVERATNVTTTWSSTYHTATPVGLFCYGSVFESLPGDLLIDNTDIFTLMADYYAGEPLSVTDVSTSTTSTSSTTGDSTTTSTTSGSTTDGGTTDPNLILYASAGLGIVVLVAVVYVLRRR